MGILLKILEYPHTEKSKMQIIDFKKAAATNKNLVLH